MITAGLTGDLLGAWYTSQSAMRTAAVGGPKLSGAGAGKAPERDPNVLPPWDPRGEVAALETLKRSVLGGGKFFDKSFGEFSSMNVPDDEKTLFALHQGLRRLQSLAAAAGEKNVNAFDQMFWDKKFQEGLEEMSAFFGGMDLEKISVLPGEDLTRAQSDLSTPRGISEYTTGIVHRGAFDAEVAAFQGDVQFDITVRKNGQDITIAIDLDELGAQPRTLDTVIGHINSKLEENEIFTRFERVRIGTPNEFGNITGNDWGFKINGILTEQVSFDAPAGQPAVYMSAISGTGDNAAGQLIKLTDVFDDPKTAFAKRIQADPTLTEKEIFGSDETRQVSTANPLTIHDIAQGPDGGIYVVGQTQSAANGQDIRGESDLVLMRYDSNGKLVWSRTLGAADEASGASLAVGPDGSVAVAGSVTGALGDTREASGQDSLVVKYGADGVEQWAQRFGGTGNDRANAVTIGADGTVFVAGEARGGFDGMANQGSLDGYVRAIGADGQTLYTRSVDSGPGIERAQAVTTAPDGGLLIASEVDGRAVLTRFAPGDDGTGEPEWSLDMGALNGGRITAIKADADGSIYLTGGAGAGFAPSPPVNENSGGRDAFLVKVGAGGQVDYTTFLGTDGDDLATGIDVVDGKVYLSGSTTGSLPGAELSGSRNSFAAGFDAASGAHEWTQQIPGYGGSSQATGIVVDPKGDSVLDRLGLPSGQITYADTRVVTAHSATRSGDHFYMTVDGGRKRKITIEPGETMRSLTFKINAVLLNKGNASVARANGGDALRIEPRQGVKIEFFRGDDGQDALSGLGLPEGQVRGKPKTGSRDETSAAPPVFALGLSSSLSIKDQNSAKAASEALQKAIETIQNAWRKLTEDPALNDLMHGPAHGKRGGTVPAHLQSQLANYQAGLDRLMAGPSEGQSLGLF